MEQDALRGGAQNDDLYIVCIAIGIGELRADQFSGAGRDEHGIGILVGDPRRNVKEHAFASSFVRSRREIDYQW